MNKTEAKKAARLNTVTPRYFQLCVARPVSGLVTTLLRLPKRALSGMMQKR